MSQLHCIMYLELSNTHSKFQSKLVSTLKSSINRQSSAYYEMPSDVPSGLFKNINLFSFPFNIAHSYKHAYMYSSTTGVTEEGTKWSPASAAAAAQREREAMLRVFHRSFHHRYRPYHYKPYHHCRSYLYYRSYHHPL